MRSGLPRKGRERAEQKHAAALGAGFGLARARLFGFGRTENPGTPVSRQRRLPGWRVLQHHPAALQLERVHADQVYFNRLPECMAA